MQDITNITNYSTILSDGDYSVEWAIDIGDAGRLIDNVGDYITFSRPGAPDPIRLLLSSAGAENGYREDMLISVTITNSMFSGSPELGKAVSAEIDVEMRLPVANIPRRAAIRAYNRIFNASLTSGWIEQGTFYIDTREITKNLHGDDIIKLHGYDAMLMTEQAYVWTLQAPATDIDVVRDIANQLQFDVDQRTIDIMTNGYTVDVEQVGTYTMREVLAYLAGAYAGSFIMSPQNELRLVQLVTPPGETNYLATEEGGIVYAILFGADKILV